MIRTFDPRGLLGDCPSRSCRFAQDDLAGRKSQATCMHETFVRHFNEHHEHATPGFNALMDSIRPWRSARLVSTLLESTKCEFRVSSFENFSDDRTFDDVVACAVRGRLAISFPQFVTKILGFRSNDGSCSAIAICRDRV